eukprot:SAG31_NODE_20072_length_584_cov_1.191753_2_plen_94_part_01
MARATLSQRLEGYAATIHSAAEGYTRVSADLLKGSTTETAKRQEDTDARSLAVLLQQFEEDRVELYRIVLGDVCHSSMRFHAHALQIYSSLLPE